MSLLFLCSRGRGCPFRGWPCPRAAAYLPGLDMEALAHVALGGLYGAALFIARSPEPATARAQADAVLDTLITGLRTGAAPATTDG